MQQRQSAQAQGDAGSHAQEAPSWPGKQTRVGDGAAAGAPTQAGPRSRGAAAAAGATSPTRMEDWRADSMMGAMGLGGGGPSSSSSEGQREAQRQGQIVANSARPTKPGQLTQAAFLAQLRGAVSRTASQIAGPTWSADSCPDIPRLFAHYASLDAAACERIASRYAGVSSPSSAAAYIAPICARLTGVLTRWRRGEELSWAVGASGLPIAAEESSGGGGKSEEPGGGSVSVAELGAGAPMESGVASRMGAAFGTSFDDVRVHTGADAAQQTHSLGADALALGSHVAFGAGQYQPGTPEGDGLIAHELAHVMQQRGGAPLTQQRAYSVQSGDAYEHDADHAAAAVVARLHGGESSAERAPAAEPIRPALATGLGVRRGNRPDIEATPEAMGQHMVEGISRANKPAAGGGVYYWHDAKAKLEAAGGTWLPHYRYGHHFTSWKDPTSPFFTQPHGPGDSVQFMLNPRQSASAAVKAWLAGPTIAECLTIAIALQLDTMRAAIGDEKFDEIYGSIEEEKDRVVRADERQLLISPKREEMSVFPMLEATAVARAHGREHQSERGELSKHHSAKLQLGEMYYIGNHRRYVSKHPAYHWQGLNVIYMGTSDKGEALWSGLGVDKWTEAEVLEHMVSEYNKPRTKDDFAEMIARKILVQDPLGVEAVEGISYRYADNDFVPPSAPAIGGFHGDRFPDQISVKAAKQAGAGLVLHQGVALNPRQIQEYLPKNES